MLLTNATIATMQPGQPLLVGGALAVAKRRICWFGPMAEAPDDPDPIDLGGRLLTPGLIEVKSGYGLDLDTERKMLRVARAIEGARPLRVRTSFLGAHALPADYRGRADAYLDRICLPALEAAAAEIWIPMKSLICLTVPGCSGFTYKPVSGSGPATSFIVSLSGTV